MNFLLLLSSLFAAFTFYIFISFFLFFLKQFFCHWPRCMCLSMPILSLSLTEWASIFRSISFCRNVFFRRVIFDYEKKMPKEMWMCICVFRLLLPARNDSHEYFAAFVPIRSKNPFRFVLLDCCCCCRCYYHCSFLTLSYSAVDLIFMHVSFGGFRTVWAHINSRIWACETVFECIHSSSSSSSFFVVVGLKPCELIN